MFYFKNDSGVRAIFGDKVFKKLVNTFSDCCNECGNFPSEKYSISSTPGCAGAFPFITLTITALCDIDGVTKVTALLEGGVVGGSTEGSIIARDIKKGDSFTITIERLSSGESATVAVIDNKGNWSNTLSLIVIDCP